MMNAAGLSTAIQTELTAAGFEVIAQNTVFCDAIATAVVAHITANAETTTEVTGGSSIGTYAGSVK